MKFLAVADIHLCKSVPVCRTETEEEWLDFQFQVLHQIFSIAQVEKAALLIAGDIFDRSAPGMRVVNRFLELRNKFSKVTVEAIAGNHDIPYHNFNLIADSGFGTLIESGVFGLSNDVALHHFNTKKPAPRSITLCHHLVFPDKKSIPPNVSAKLPSEIFDMYPDSALVVCGDYHQSHYHSNGGQTLIVPGCVTIQSAGLANYEPVALLWDSDCPDEVEEFKLVNDKSKISTEHLTKEKARNENIEKFISTLRAKGKVGLSFSDNLREKLNDPSLPKRVKEIIIKIREEI